MFELSTTTALMLYLIGTLLPLLSLWGYTHFKKRQHKIIIHEHDLLVCEFCHFGYLSEKGKALSQCPQCHLYNKIMP